MAEFGSLGNIDPSAMAALREALQRRQQGGQVPALDTQSTSSPTASPLPAQPSGGVAAPSGTAPSSGLPGEALPPTENQEARLIIGALKERLKAISTIEGGVPQTGSL